MEGELWTRLYQLVMDVAKRQPRKPGVIYPDAWILLIDLWAALHDRPQGWACQRRHWPAAVLQHRPLPCEGQLSVRLRTVSLRNLMHAVMAEARQKLPDSLIKCIDAKPLPVGGHSKDRDTKRGRATNGQARGYKLYAVDDGTAVDSWKIGPMNEPEVMVARQLLPETGPGYVLGDSLYDSNALHALAQRHGQQLVAPRKQPGTGLGHGPQKPARRRAIELLEGPGRFGRSLYACRGSIEQRFGQAGNLACGLGPLPNWVRRPHRVALWVAAKLLIVTCWNQQKQRLAA